MTCELCTKPEVFRCAECLVPLCADHALTDGERVYCANDFAAFGVVQDIGPGTRSNKQLIGIALRDESVQLTKDEAIQFITEHRNLDAQHAAGVEFMVKGYGAQDELDEEMYVGGQDDRDIDNFLENNLADYDEFQLWATSYCTTPVNDQSCVERMVSVKCNNCIRRMSEIARLGE